jgi:hypothetical protein
MEHRLLSGRSSSKLPIIERGDRHRLSANLLTHAGQANNSESSPETKRID